MSSATNPRIVDVRTGGAQTLRLAVVNDGRAGQALILSHGFGVGENFIRPGYCGTPLRIPVDAIPELRAALELLGDQDPELPGAP